MKLVALPPPPVPKSQRLPLPPPASPLKLKPLGFSPHPTPPNRSHKRTLQSTVKACMRFTPPASQPPLTHASTHVQTHFGCFVGCQMLLHLHRLDVDDRFGKSRLLPKCQFGRVWLNCWRAGVAYSWWRHAALLPTSVNSKICKYQNIRALYGINPPERLIID